uniref:Uncharacterized protein n=1 Tax=Megaselia scalaris TaxID=36166 RepID=T1GDT1_MEGSC
MTHCLKLSFTTLPVLSPVLKPGVVQVYENDGKTSKYFVSSGTVTVNNDSSVQVLAEEAHPIDSLDAAECRQVLSQCQQQLSSAQTDLARAEANIAIECAEALVKAAE